MKKIIFFILGIAFLIVGVIGLILPVIPQVPFFVMAVLCFTEASERFHKWFSNTRIYKKYIEPHIKKESKE